METRQQTSTRANPVGRHVQISSIENSRVRQEAENLRAGIENFGESARRQPPRAARQSTEYEDWTTRLGAVEEVVDMIQNQVNDGSIMPGDAVRVTAGEHTTGIMTVSVSPKEEDAKDAFWIDNIVTHPGAAGAGELLIEKAVAMSASKGFGGTVRLMAFSGQTFYKSVGFKDLGGGLMELRPAQSNKWSNVNGTLLLSRRMHKSGLVQDIPRTVPQAELQLQTQLGQASPQDRIEYALQLRRHPELSRFAQSVMQGLQQAVTANRQLPPMQVCDQTLRQCWSANEEQRPLYNKLIRAFAAR